MSATNNQSPENGQVGIIFALLLVVFLIWVFVGGRHPFHNTGQDLKSTGRDAADSIRNTVQ